MPLFQMRLFHRIISKRRDVFVLKIVTLAIAFASATLITLFALNEFGYDRFHEGSPSIFRVLSKNTNEKFEGNRISTRIPYDVLTSLQSRAADSLILSRLIMMDELNIRTGGNTFYAQKIYAADADITRIFSFHLLNGSVREFQQNEHTAILSASTALKYFGTIHATGQKLEIFSIGDTIRFPVAAVYDDYPQNSHEELNIFIRFDSTTLQSLRFNPADAGIYGKLLQGQMDSLNMYCRGLQRHADAAYSVQPLSQIYFGPSVLGEGVRHGDRYSIMILISITSLIFLLAITNFVNLTTLTLPYRSKELAVKKLAGIPPTNLMLGFARESFYLAGVALVLAIIILLLSSFTLAPILKIDLISLLATGNLSVIFIMFGLFMIAGIAPVFVTSKFTRATPTRLLSTDAITFPRLKRVVIILQLGISLFLIVASMVIKRQIAFSLLKEPGRNHDQIVYVNYPADLTNEGLTQLRTRWKENNAHILDLMATSQLPNHLESKALRSGLYTMSVDPDFKDFFKMKIVQGNWFKANDGDSIQVINETARKLLGNTSPQVAGVFQDMSGDFNTPEKPIAVNKAPYFRYNYLFIKVLEVDIQRTVRFLATYFGNDRSEAPVSFLNKRFEAWLHYQDQLNALSTVLALITIILSCCSIYGLSVSVTSDKLKQIAVHKLFGASTWRITRLLVTEFAKQMLITIAIFAPITFMVIKESLRSFVYATHFVWRDPVLPLFYCSLIIILLCGFQALRLNHRHLSAALKG